jgi:hypothetical protein
MRVFGVDRIDRGKDALQTFLIHRIATSDCVPPDNLPATTTARRPPKKQPGAGPFGRRPDCREL